MYNLFVTRIRNQIYLSKFSSYPVTSEDAMHLIITEKHDTAKRIAAILSEKKPDKERVNGVDTYNFNGTTVIGLSGHIVEVDFPKEYNNWQKTDLQSLIHAKVLTNPTHANIVTAIRKLGKTAQHLTIATDYDREGELIGVEALNVVKKVNPDIYADRVHYSTCLLYTSDAADE